ncbi:MAG: hypothetical protein KDC26_08025 [Armatimonadetes bacterium]|nr:hypothetical protein [Armatimonadota bacterium]
MTNCSPREQFVGRAHVYALAIGDQLGLPNEELAEIRDEIERLGKKSIGSANPLVKLGGEIAAIHDEGIFDPNEVAKRVEKILEDDKKTLDAFHAIKGLIQPLKLS